MLSDTIADMITRIRNGYLARKKAVDMPYSNLKKDIASILKDNGYVQAFEVTEDGHKKNLSVTLLYKNNQPAIQKIVKVSKAGRRMYAGKSKLPYVLSGLGHAIITTSKGVMTDHDARKQGLGGEIICKVW